MKVRFIGTKTEMKALRERIRSESSEEVTMMSKMHPSRNNPSEFRMYVEANQIFNPFHKDANRT